MYERSKPPVHTGIKQVACIRHFYTRFADNGEVVDSESLELELGRIEAAAAPILVRSCHNQWPSQPERLVLAEWLSYLLTRVPAHRRRIDGLYPANLEKLIHDWTSQFDSMIDGSEDERTKRRLTDRKAEVLDILTSRRENRPSDLNVAFVSPKYGQLLAAMRWIFLKAPGKFRFFTNDNPIFFHEKIGLIGDERSRTWAQVSVPLSADTALLLTWRPYDEGYVMATDHIVREINKRTVRGASRYVFHSTQAEWVQRLVNKDFSGAEEKSIELETRSVKPQYKPEIASLPQ